MAILQTISGARIATLPLDLARAFLHRHGTTDYEPAPFDLSWGAFEDAGSLVGVGVLVPVSALRGRVWIAVVPERRRLGMGSELAALVTTEAQRRGLRYLTCRHHAGDAASDRLARSLGLPLGRRVDGEVVWTVTVLPQDDQGETT